MDGYYTAFDEERRFVTKACGKGRSFKIPLQTSPLLRTVDLSDLYFFLQHMSKLGEIFMIFEPESQLDTAIQITLARLVLASFVRSWTERSHRNVTATTLLRKSMIS